MLQATNRSSLFKISKNRFNFSDSVVCEIFQKYPINFSMDYHSLYTDYTRYIRNYIEPIKTTHDTVPVA